MSIRKISIPLTDTGKIKGTVSDLFNKELNVDIVFNTQTDGFQLERDGVTYTFKEGKVIKITFV